MNKKICIKEYCELTGIEQPLENFPKNKSYRDGFSNTCKKCQKIYQDQYNKEHRLEHNIYKNNWSKEQRQGPQREKFLEKRRALDRKWRETHSEEYILKAARSRAKKFKLDFNLTIEDVKIPEFCPVLGIPLFFSVYNKRKENIFQKDNTPSLDRIDNKKGYIKGNVCIISWKANNMKKNMSLEDITKLYEYVSMRTSKKFRKSGL